MKRILFVSKYGRFFGGGEFSLFELIKNVDLSRFASVVVFSEKGDFYSRTADLGFVARVIRMPSLKGSGLFSLPLSAQQLLALIREHNIDVIHANSSRSMIYAGLVGWLARVPVIWHVRVTDLDPLLDPLLVRLATGIIVNSEAVARRFGSSWMDKVRVVHNGVDLRKFGRSVSGERIRQEFSIREEEDVVTIVGRLTEEKGHRFFLEAAQKVLAHTQTVRFLIVGDGKLRNGLEALSRDLDIEEHVVFFGTRTDIPQILSASNVVVSSSLSEGFGRVIVEAMAMAKPVVGTRVGGVPEVIIDGVSGILVEPENSEEIADATLLLLKDPEHAREMGVAGFNRVKESFSIEKHVCEIEEIYESL